LRDKLQPALPALCGAARRGPLGRRCLRFGGRLLLLDPFVKDGELLVLQSACGGEAALNFRMDRIAQTVKFPNA
jgi:hypothetical protein